MRTKPLICGLALLLTTTGSLAQQQPDPELRAALIEAIENSESFTDRFEAEVWLLDMSTRLGRYIKDPEVRLHILRAAHREARRAEVFPQLVLAVMHTESLFQQFAISSAGAQGLMQVMSFWKKEIGRPDDDLMDIDTNLRYGCTILAHYLKKEKGDVVRALARYNGSLGKTWYAERVLSAWDRYWE